MPSSKCVDRLKSPPPCGETRAMRSWVFCRAFQKLSSEKGMDLSTAMKAAYSEARQKCPTK